MSSHTMTCNANSLRIQLRKRRENRLGQFVRDICVHIVAGVVGRLGCVDVESRSRPEVVRVVFAFNVQTAYTNSIHQLVLFFIIIIIIIIIIYVLTQVV